MESRQVRNQNGRSPHRGGRKVRQPCDLIVSFMSAATQAMQYPVGAAASHPTGSLLSPFFLTCDDSDLPCQLSLTISCCHPDKNAATLADRVPAADASTRDF